MGDAPVMGHAHGKEYAGRTKAPGLAGAHGRMDAEPPGLIGRRRHDAPFAQPPTMTGWPRRAGLSRCSTEA